MSSNLALQPEPAPIVACTISRDVQDFDLLIEDMETELGEGWGDLDFQEALAFFKQPDAGNLEFVTVAVDDADEARLTLVADVIRTAKETGIKVILIADGLSPMTLHELLRAGADDFVPYPLPQNALSDAIARLRNTSRTVLPTLPLTEPAAPQQPVAAVPTGGGGSLSASETVCFAIHSLAGGAGSTTLAVNLAWEMANMEMHGREPKVCIIDLDLQFGSVATYLDLPRKELIYEILADTQAMDEQAFRQGLTPFNDKIQVFTAPSDILPLDLIGPDDVSALIALARQCFDVVIIDMPTAVSQWTETVLNECDIYFALVELELRSAQNVLRMVRALRAEELPVEKISYILNRGPKLKDVNGKNRVARMADSLGITFKAQLTDGGKQVTECNDHGVPLAERAPKNVLRKDIVKLAETLAKAAEADVKKEKPAGRSFFGLKFGR